MTPKEILALPDGTIFHKQSQHHSIEVRKHGTQLRLVFLDSGKSVRATQTRLDLLHPDSLVARYAQVVFLALAWQPRPARVLMIGLGGGLISMVMHRALPETEIVAVEIDPEVVKAGKQYFGLIPDHRLHVVIDDGRSYLEKVEESDRYDIIILDAYQGDGTAPARLVTQEFYQLCQSRLTPQGVIVVNTIRMHGLFYRVIRTMLEVWPHVAMVPAKGNEVLFGFKEGETEEAVLMEHARAIDTRDPLPFGIVSHAQGIRFADKVYHAQILRDGETSPQLSGS